MLTHQETKCDCCLCRHRLGYEGCQNAFCTGNNQSLCLKCSFGRCRGAKQWLANIKLLTNKNAQQLWHCDGCFRVMRQPVHGCGPLNRLRRTSGNGIITSEAIKLSLLKREWSVLPWPLPPWVSKQHGVLEALQTEVRNEATPRNTRPHYATLSYTKLSYTKLSYTTLRYTTLRYATLSYTTLPYTALHYTRLHYARATLS